MYPTKGSVSSRFSRKKLLFLGTMNGAKKVWFSGNKTWVL